MALRTNEVVEAAAEDVGVAAAEAEWKVWRSANAVRIDDDSILQARVSVCVGSVFRSKA